jgi:hypothetical protein
MPPSDDQNPYMARLGMTRKSGERAIMSRDRPTRPARGAEVDLHPMARKLVTPSRFPNDKWKSPSVFCYLDTIMSEQPCHRIAAILPRNDIEASTAFYNRLGFSVHSDHGRYRILSDGKGWLLHLSS